MRSFFALAATLALASRGAGLDAPALPPAPAGVATADLAGLRAALVEARHAARSVPGGFVASNPGQRWTSRFDGRGLATTPAAGGWTFELELERYGFAGQLEDLGAPAALRAEGGRVIRAWSPTLEEWYVNDARGLEHGFTLHERPPAGACAGAPLVLELVVRGGWRAEVEGDGRTAHFSADQGGAVLTYSGLVAFDADGRDLCARLEPTAAGLRVCVDEEDARYPLTIDPVLQQAYLKASNTQAGDQFGWAVSVSGDTAVVGARFEDSASTGVNGDQSSNAATNSGAAYVFVRNGSAWSQEAYLKASNPDANDWFGHSVAISGDTIVVGAPIEDSAATGVDGDASNNSASGSGAAYVFVRSGSTWSQQAYLKASNTGADDSFGWSVSISGDTIVVGAHQEDSNATGVDGDGNNDLAGASGAAYVYGRSGTTWTQEAYLKASNTGGFDFFGISVSISGDTLVVGASNEASSSPGIDGDQSNNSLAFSGAAYVFVRSGSTWSQQAYVKASNPGLADGFGLSVAVSGDRIVIGAWAEDSAATGVGGDQSSEAAFQSGAAYVFGRSGSTWSQEAYLKASNTGAEDNFGTWVSISGERIVIAAPYEDSASAGVDGDQSDNSLSAAGAVYAFESSGGVWSQVAYLKASHPDSQDFFGQCVSISDDTVLVGGHWEDSGATGVNGDPSDDSAADSGAAWVFDLEAVPPGTPVCFGDGTGAPCGCGNEAAPGSGGCANAGPMPAGQGALLSASGSTSVAADDLVLTVDFTTNQPGLFFQGNNVIGGGTGVTFGDGVRCCGGSVVRLEIVDPPGTAGPKTASTTQPILGTSPAATTTAGDTRCYQWWYRNPGTSACGATSNFNLSNAVYVTWTL